MGRSFFDPAPPRPLTRASSRNSGTFFDLARGAGGGTVLPPPPAQLPAEESAFDYVARWRPAINVNPAPSPSNFGMLMPANFDRVAARVILLPGLFTDPACSINFTDQPISNPTGILSNNRGVLVSEPGNRECRWDFPTAPHNALYYIFNPGGGSNVATIFIEEVLRVRRDVFDAATQAARNTGPVHPLGSTS